MSVDCLHYWLSHDPRETINASHELLAFEATSRLVAVAVHEDRAIPNPSPY